jgi:hypothetical protein
MVKRNEARPRRRQAMNTPIDRTSTPPGETSAPQERRTRGAVTSKGIHEAMTVRLAIVHAGDDDDGPPSRPTVLIEVDEHPRAPTALPGPPPLPVLSTFEPRLPSSAIPTKVALQVVSSRSGPAIHATKKMPIVTKLHLVRAMRDSSPPSFPPPPYRSAA